MKNELTPTEEFIKNTKQAIEKIRDNSESDEQFRQDIKNAIDYFIKMNLSCDDILKPVINIAFAMFKAQLI